MTHSNASRDIMSNSNEPLCPCCGTPVSPLDVLIDGFSRVIAYNGETAKLTPKEMALFQALLQAYPRSLSRSQIMDAVYGDTPDAPEPKIVDVFICKIRRRIAPLKLDFETDWGIGFRLSASDQIEAAKNRYAMQHKRTACTPQDLPTIRMYRAQGLPITDIARRLGMSFRAVVAGIDEIALAERSRAA